MKQRDNYYSFMKGIAIIAVLFIHTNFMSDGAFGIASRQLFTFAVSMFFFLSGFFVKDENFDRNGIIRLLIPYVIWSVLWFIETTVKCSQPITLWKVFNTVFLGGAFFPLYFLIVLIELKLFSPFVVRNIRRLSDDCAYQWYRDWMLLITPLSLGFIYYIQYVTRQQPAVYAQVFPVWFITYYTGCLVKHGNIKINGLTAVCCTLLGLYLMNVESTYINEVIGVPFWAVSQLKFSSFFYSISLCFLIFALHTKIERGIIVKLGEYSFGIFLLHLPVKMGVEKFVNYIIPVSNPFWQIIVVIITLVLCWSIIELSNRLLPQKINRYLGFK